MSQYDLKIKWNEKLKLQDMNPCGEWRENSSICNLTTKWWEAISFTPLIAGQEAGCAPEPAWTRQRRAKPLPLPGGDAGHWLAATHFTELLQLKKGEWRI
jgi:hypothetical protein